MRISKPMATAFERWSDFGAGTKLVGAFYAVATVQEAMRMWPDDRNVVINYRMSIRFYRIILRSCHAAALRGPRSVVIGAYPIHALTRSVPSRMGTGVEVRVGSAAPAFATNVEPSCVENTRCWNYRVDRGQRTLASTPCALRYAPPVEACRHDNHKEVCSSHALGNKLNCIRKLPKTSATCEVPCSSVRSPLPLRSHPLGGGQRNLL